MRPLTWLEKGPISARTKAKASALPQSGPTENSVEETYSVPPLRVTAIRQSGNHDGSGSLGVQGVPPDVSVPLPLVTATHGWIGGSVFGNAGLPSAGLGVSDFFGLTSAARSRLIDLKLSPGVT